MTESSSVREFPVPPGLIWVTAALAFVGVECILVYAEFARPSLKPWFFHFLYAPMMISIPLTTAWPLHRSLRKKLEAINEIGLTDRISSAFAILVLASYLALAVGLFEFL